MSKYSFSKIKSFSNFEPEILIDKNHLFYFDSKGSIIKFDNNSKNNLETKKYPKIYSKYQAWNYNLSG